MHKIQNKARSVLPDRLISGAAAVYAELKRALAGFVKAQLTLVAMTMVLVLIGLSVLKVNHAVAIAFLIGLVDLLPYLGAGSVFVPWIVYLAASKQLPLAIGLGVLYIVVLVFRQLAEPKILSRSIGLHPLGTLIALFAGFKLFGFLGLIMGPALLVLIQALFTTGIFKDVWQFIKGNENKRQPAFSNAGRRLSGYLMMLIRLPSDILFSLRDMNGLKRLRVAGSSSSKPMISDKKPGSKSSMPPMKIQSPSKIASPGIFPY